ncbi:MAG: TetR/AcrR family transcriptional regulator [Candidatus Nanopelagicales bacterium]|nr:TetR/AcrR family transcriptional regulator [Candidatus Nanopelagicales bacterium]
MVDQRLVRGAQTKQEVLRAAADLASRRGLEALTLGALADQLEMSKSGVVKHFGSREQLQLATIEYAVGVFAQVVLSDAAGMPPGLQRLRTTTAAWLDYLTGSTFSGGCFFYAAAAELDRQPGPLRDRIKTTVTAGLSLLRDDLQAAVESGELQAHTDVGQVLFELHAYLQEVSLTHLLLDDPHGRARGEQAIAALLDRHGGSLSAVCPAQPAADSP